MLYMRVPRPARVTTIAILVTAAALAGLPGTAQPTNRDSFFLRLVDAAIERASHEVVYDGGYRGIPYPGGDVVTWMLPGNLPHIGLITDRGSADGRRPLIVHNIGDGPEIEDSLFKFPVTGHYRYRPGSAETEPPRAP